METMIHPKNNTIMDPKAWIPLSAGLLFLLYHQVFSMPIPSFIFGWPFIIVLIGLFIGSIAGFSHPISMVLTLFGLIFTFTIQLPVPNGEIWFPASCIVWGLFFTSKSKWRNNL